MKKINIKNKNSVKKICGLKELISKKCKKTLFLDGDLININGIKILKLPMWYDFTYVRKENRNKSKMLTEWKRIMRGVKYIDFENIEFADLQIKFDPFKF